MISITIDSCLRGIRIRQTLKNLHLGLDIIGRELQNESRQHNRQQSRAKRRRKKFNVNLIEICVRLWYSFNGTNQNLGVVKMKEWFTVEKIDTDTFAISEYGHWEETHCYLLCGAENAVLIDTGLGIANIKKVTDSLTTLPIMVVTTHVHWDHIGGHKYFDNIAVHEAEKDWLSVKFPIPLQAVKSNLMCKPCDFPPYFNVDSYQIFQGMPQRIFRNGDCVTLGDRKLTVIHTPGHSPGHCCFYEPERKYLFSGDLIYNGCLDAFYPTTNPLLFWQSVKKVKSLEIKRILPAHHQLNISVSIIERIENAFSELADKGMLKQGAGIFEFEDFQIHI